MLSWSQIVPLGGYVMTVEMSVETTPEAVPAMRKRRFGYVCAGTEQNQRLASVKVLASE